EALPHRQADLGRGALGDASPELLLLPVDDVHGAALCIDGLRAEVDEAAQVRLAVLLDSKVAKLDQDERDLVVKHGDIPPRPPDVGSVSADRVLHAPLRAEESRDDRAGIYAEPEGDVQAALLALGDDPALHLERALDGLARRILHLERRAPEHHDVVAVELVHGAFVAIHDVHHTVEVPVEVAEENLRSQSLRN